MGEFMDSNYKLGLYEKAMPASLSWHDKLSAAKNSGFDYVEISIDETEGKLSRLLWTKEIYAKLHDIIAETGVPIGSVCLSAHRKYPLGSPDEAVREKSLEIMERALDLACELGARVIQLAGYDVYYEDSSGRTRGLFAESLRKAVDMASKYGVLLGFETMETPFMDTVEKAMKYVNLIDSPYLGVYPDIGNLQNAALIYGKPAYEDIITGKGHIVAAHLKETLPDRYREVPFSTGHTDYIGCITQLKKQDVKRYVGEFWYKGSALWRDDIKNAAVFLRNKLDAVWNRA
jgi:L-ribulose-5-phosphate 3-epimerase/hexulose-6-phosphate isomerase